MRGAGAAAGVAAADPHQPCTLRPPPLRRLGGRPAPPCGRLRVRLPSTSSSHSRTRAGAPRQSLRRLPPTRAGGPPPPPHLLLPPLLLPGAGRMGGVATGLSPPGSPASVTAAPADGGSGHPPLRRPRYANHRANLVVGGGGGSPGAATGAVVGGGGGSPGATTGALAAPLQGSPLPPQQRLPQSPAAGGGGVGFDRRVGGGVRGGRGGGV